MVRHTMRALHTRSRKRLRRRPPGEAKNGFLALAVFDQPEQGGHADGVRDRRDVQMGRWAWDVFLVTAPQ